MAQKKTNPYQYAGQGWNDPLAQQIFKEFNPYGSKDVGGFVSREAANSAGYTPGGVASGASYHTFLDPKEWGGSYKGDEFNKMKEAYIARGGQGTYEQQAAYPGATNWPIDASGNPLPRLNMTTGQAESIVPGAPAPGEGSGSANTLSPDVLKKMWR